MLVLGIETSCDDTGVALFCSERGLLDHVLYTQQVHLEFNGIVPELASRDHVKLLPVLVQQLLSNNNVEFSDLNLIAYTYAPGLIGSLLTGVAFAKSLSFGLNIPAVKVHHLEGHIWSPFIKHTPPTKPFLSLLVSGGHTMLILVERFGQYKMLGETLDDAVGEAFDKVAKSMGLGYPGGAALAKLAAEYKETAVQHTLPWPLTKYKQPESLHYLNFSFSGIKSHMKRLIDADATTENLIALAYSFEQHMAAILVDKIVAACNVTGLNLVVISGGVSANKVLRERLQALNNIEVMLPDLEFCTDNGAMIAYAGYHNFMQHGADKDLAIIAKARAIL